MKITASFVLVLIVTVCLSMVCNYFIGLSFMVIVVFVWLSNKLLKRHIRLTNCEKIDYMNGSWKFWSLFIAFCFGSVGYFMLIFLGGIERIPSDYFEAATID